MQQNTQNTIDSFINNMIDKKGYADASPEIKTEIYKSLQSKLDEFILTRTIAQFSDEELADFEKLLDEDKSAAELTKFATTYIPDYTTFLTSTLLAFQEAYLS